MDNISLGADFFERLEESVIVGDELVAKIRSREIVGDVDVKFLLNLLLDNLEISTSLISYAENIFEELLVSEKAISKEVETLIRKSYLGFKRRTKLLLQEEVSKYL